MFLEQNLAKLNERLSKHGLHLEKQGDKIVVVEEVMYRLNNRPLLKKELRQEYDLRFQGDYSPKYWYIGNEGIKKLSSRLLKTKPTKPADELKTKLTTFIEQIENTEIKNGIKKLLEENPYYYKCPAAKRYHHAYKHGLLEHTTQIIDLAFGLIKTFDDGIQVNKDLIIAGSILHDIGKINCYKLVDGGIDVCSTISEQDHIVNGVKLASQYIQCNEVDQLLHIIASHHKEKQYGSPVSPISNEAWIISLTDDLSSKIMG
ncbi:MAG: HD domain-containing protein [Candidatus Bathyarchaeota archaeon]|nr:HD domain-containing protein [Candidatus Bathyarchaeum sp.]